MDVDVCSGTTLVTVGSEVVPAWVAVEELLLHEVISKTSKSKKFIFRGIYTFHNLAKAALQGRETFARFNIYFAPTGW